MDFKNMLNTHLDRFEDFSEQATSRYEECREEYARLAEAESRIIAALITKM